MRLFNSGQDCAGPDVFLVSRSVADQFVRRLEEMLASVEVGLTTEDGVRSGQSRSTRTSPKQLAFSNEKPEHIVFGGDIGLESRLIQPTIIRKDAAEHSGSFHEFFGPIFYVLEFEGVEDLAPILSAAAFREHSMYASVFGADAAVEALLTPCRILRDVTVNDVEHGNDEYGGFSESASLTALRGRRDVGPILLSRDMHLRLGSDAHQQFRGVT